MSSPTETGSSPSAVDPTVIRHSPVPAGLSSLQYQSEQETSIPIQAISCTLSQTDVVRIVLQLKEFLHEEIDYTIKATIDQYKDEIVKLTKENEKLRDDIDALEQYGRRDLMRINGI